MVAMAVAMTAAMEVAWRWRRGEGGGDGGAAMAAAMAGARGGVDGRGRTRGRGGGEDSGASCVGPEISLPLGVVRRGAVSYYHTPLVCAENTLFQVTPLDWVFQHWSPRIVTSRHNDCLTKCAVGERAVGKQARKYCLLIGIVAAGT